MARRRRRRRRLLHEDGALVNGNPEETEAHK
jgi:hypothetical protein